MSKQRIENIQTTEQSQFLQHSALAILNGQVGGSKKHKHQSHGRIDNYTQILWKQSPSSLTRHRAPSHKIPKAQRFGTTKLDELKVNQTFTSQEQDPLNKTGISFGRSNRPEHFLKEELAQNPSPVSYHFARFMDGTHYKVKTEKSESHSPLKKNSSVKGATMNNFFNYHKSYVPHSKHRQYQPQSTIDNPAANHYTINWSNKKKEIKYTFRVNLKKFNQNHNNFPGPSAYHPQKQPPRSSSFNAKGTFGHSNRTYLQTIKQGPASNHYNIHRFLESEP